MRASSYCSSDSRTYEWRPRLRGRTPAASTGGGAVALIAWSEFRTTAGFTDEPGYVVVASLFAAIIGSVSFWGSLVAYGKLQEILPGRPIGLGRAQQAVNGLLLAVAVACAVVAGLGGASELWIVGLLVVSAVLGVLVVLPIGGADMPVVISLLNALTGLSAAAAGLALDNTAMIVAGMIVGASGSILTNQMAVAMNRTIPAIVAGGFGGTTTLPGADDGVERSPLGPDAVARYFAGGARTRALPGVGHFLQREAPDAVADAILT